ncbi:hypothetical protein QEN19_001099 [Hanseniaspora menglaensis]
MVQSSSNSQSISTQQQQQNVPSVKQRKLQQQYKQNIVQYNKLNTVKSNEKYINKQQQKVNSSTAKNNKKNKKVTVGGSKRPELTESNEGSLPSNTLLANEDKIGHISKDEKDGTSSTNKKVLGSNDDMKSNNNTFAKEQNTFTPLATVKIAERRGSSSTWNLQQKAAMPYGIHSNDDDDDDDSLLSQVIANPLAKTSQIQSNQVHFYQQTPQPVHLTPLQQQVTLNMPMPGSGGNFNPMIMHNNTPQQLQPLNYQMQKQLGMPSLMQPPLHPPPPNINQQQFQHQYRMFMMEQQRKQMMGTNISSMMGAPPMMNNVPMMLQAPGMNMGDVSPKIGTITSIHAINGSTLPSDAYSQHHFSSNDVSSDFNVPKSNGNKLKKQRDYNAVDVLTAAPPRKSQYAGTSFGLAAPVLESFPKPSF